jgi:hypothetical protein
MHAKRDPRNSQKGVSLILCLLVLLILMGLSGTLVLSVNSEILASNNAKMMMQARYAAEAGMQRALNWFVYSYTPNTSSYSSYGTGVEPVVYPSTGTNVVILSGSSAVNSNFPTSSVQSSFNTTLNNVSLSALGMNASYSVYAKLLSVQQSGSSTLETWQVTSVGNAAGGSNATVQLTSKIAKSLGNSLFTYAAFATSPACPGMTLDSSNVTDSYDSSTGTYTTTHVNTGGNIGSNGSVSGGSDTIHGTVVAAQVGTGTPCSYIAQGFGGTPTAHIPRLNIAIPTMPVQPTPITSLALVNQTLAPGSYGNLTSGGSAHTVHLTTGIYNFNSLTTSDGLTFVLDSTPVTINFWGTGVTNVISTGGPLTIDSGGRPRDCVIKYAGTGTFQLNDHFDGAFAIDAPNSTMHLTSTSTIYGAMIVGTYQTGSDITVHYDHDLQNAFNTASTTQITSYSWNKN